METMTAVVHSQPGELETAGITADCAVTFEHGDPGLPTTSQLKRCPQSSRTGAEDEDMWLSHDRPWIYGM